MAAVLLNPIPTRWYCPNCGATGVTTEARPHTRFHSCPALFGFSAPMAPEGVRCKIEAHEREDYEGTDDVRRDGNGRPIMSITTTRDDGMDCVVYAPTAHARAGEF